MDTNQHEFQPRMTRMTRISYRRRGSVEPETRGPRTGNGPTPHPTLSPGEAERASGARDGGAETVQKRSSFLGAALPAEAPKAFGAEAGVPLRDSCPALACR